MGDPETPPDPGLDQRKANRKAYCIGYRQALRESELALQEGSRMKSIRFVLANQRQHLNRVLTKWSEGEDPTATTPPTLNVEVIHKSLELVREVRSARSQKRAYRKGKDLPRVLHKPEREDTILGQFVGEDE